MSTRYEDVSIEPKTHLLKSYLNNRIGYAAAFSEFIDNAFDCDAHNVEIIIDGDLIRVIDDGHGCENIPAMLTLGDHIATEHTRLGRYGVGAKTAAMGLGTFLAVSSIRDGTRRSMQVDWNSATGWNLKQKIEDNIDKPSGTELRISKLHRVMRRFEEIRRDLSFNFAPGIKAGRSITIQHQGNEHKLLAECMPEFEEGWIRETAEHHDKGWKFTVTAGIIKSGEAPNQHKPFIIAYEHRILTQTEEPCGGLSSSNRFMAWVELQNEWPLSTLKDGISGEAESWLIDELATICGPLLQKAHREVEIIDLADIASILNDGFAAVTGREKRDCGDTAGTSEPASTKIKRLTAEEVNRNLGICRQRHKGNLPPIIALSMESLGDTIGQVRPNSERILIVLNSDHPSIKANSRRDASLFRYYIAVSLLSSHLSREGRHSGQMLMESVIGHDGHETFINTFGSLCQSLEKQRTKEEAA